jgi:hypothetical protein
LIAKSFYHAVRGVAIRRLSPAWGRMPLDKL